MSALRGPEVSAGLTPLVPVCLGSGPHMEAEGRSSQPVDDTLSKALVPEQFV